MNKQGIDDIFHPQSIAIAGVSDNFAEFSPGRAYMKSLMDTGFKGKVYPVNPKGGEVFGLKILRSINDIPDKIDYVISTIPAKYNIQLVEECVRKGVKTVHLFAAGFSELKDETGEKLENEILKIAHQGGIRVIGPNCMGIYCPKTGLSFAADFPEQGSFPMRSGTIGLISQSGGLSTYCIKEATARDVYFSKAISYGNAADLSEADFLQYLADDPETEIIAAYIEGTKDGLRFRKALNMASKKKHVIIFKNGTSKDGIRTAASHTSALAGSDLIWDSLLKQAGAIRAHSIEEIVDVALLLVRWKPPEGRNVAIIGWGGGAGVKAADECSNAGLNIPILPAEIRQRLREIYSTEAGLIFANPVDIFRLTGAERIAQAIQAIASCDQVDFLILHISFDIFSLTVGKDTIDIYIDSILSLQRILSKPVAIVLDCCTTEKSKQLAMAAETRFREAEFPVYPSIKRAANAIYNYIQHHQRRQATAN